MKNRYIEKVRLVNDDIWGIFVNSELDCEIYEKLESACKKSKRLHFASALCDLAWSFKETSNKKVTIDAAEKIIQNWIERNSMPFETTEVLYAGFCSEILVIGNDTVSFASEVYLETLAKKTLPYYVDYILS